MVIIKQILNSFLFWGGWIIIPFIMEIVPALGSVFLLIRRNLRHKKKRKEMKIYPEISLIIPVYNSADTLYGCIKSVNDSTYPNDKIRIFLVNTESIYSHTAITATATIGLTLIILLPDYCLSFSDKREHLLL